MGVLFVYALQRLQAVLPYSLGLPPVPEGLAFNTAVSFVTNTNWQSYSPELTLGYTVQLAGLAVQNFVSAAVGIAVAIALVRGFAARRSDTLGNFWVDLVRGTFRLLLPLSIVAAIALLTAGVIQNFNGFTEVQTITGGTQVLPGGPVASQEAIKELGTNGGGFFNANSAHPFENPAPWTSLLEILLLLAIPFAMPRAFGKIVGDNRQGYAILGVMAAIFLVSVSVVTCLEASGQGTAPQLAGGAMEGKEQRYGIFGSALFAGATTLTSTGAVNSMHDSYTALGGMLPMINMMLGEVAPGGVGSGLYGMLVLAVIAVFVGGSAGRSHAGVPRQEDRPPRDQAREPVHPGDAGPRPRRHGTELRAARRSRGRRVRVDLEPRRARPQRGAVRLHLGGEQQRLGVRRAHGEHALAQHRTRCRHAARPLRADRARARARRIAREAGRRPDDGRNASDLHPAVRGTARRRRGHRHRTHLLPRTHAGSPGGRARLTMSTATLTPAPDRAPHASEHHKPRTRPFSWAQLVQALPGALRKLNPAALWRNPVMFLVWVGAALTTAIAIAEPFTGGAGESGGTTVPVGFTAGIAVWLWLTVLFANLAESVAEGRGKAQAASLRKTRTSTIAHRVDAYDGSTDAAAERAATTELASSELKLGDVVIVSAGELIPGDGDIVWGIATVDESAITGESAPVIRESGGDRSAVTGGTRVLSDRIVVSITSKPGETFVDRMIALVEGASRQKTPNEIALNILLAALSIVFVVVVLTLNPIASYAASPASITVLVALLVCLIPTTIGALLSAIGIAGMDRLVQRNVLAMSGRAVEAAGDITTLLLDKTGTITYGNRQASDFVTMPGVGEDELARVAALSSLADPTPEGTSVVALAANLGIHVEEPTDAVVVPVHRTDPHERPRPRRRFADPQGRRFGRARLARRQRRRGDSCDPCAADERDRRDRPVRRHAARRRDEERRRTTGTVLGVIHLKDIVKDGLRERFEELRRMGIRTVMITGDNPLTAKAIAAEAGVDDYLAEATPEDKLALIRREQEGGNLVAMTGDGTNDAPALAQADVGVAMNTGTSAAKEAGNMVDLDSDPTKLIDVVRIGKQLLITRGALTTFSLANDIAKYFAIIPAMFMGVFPGLGVLNVMGLHSPASAVMSAIIFNAIVIVVLIPLALRGVKYRPASASQILSRNLLVYGVGGIIAPFIGIWLIDLVVRLIPGF